MGITINGVTETWINKETSSNPTPPSSVIPKFWTSCHFCTVMYRLHRSFLFKPTTCRSCNREFYAHEIRREGLLPGKNSSKDIMHKRVLIKRLLEIHKNHPVASNSRPSFWATCRHCGYRERFLKVYKNKWFVCAECYEETVAMEVLARSGEVLFNKWFQELKPRSKKNSSGLGCGVKVGEKRKREEVDTSPQYHSKDSSGLSCDVKVGDKRKREEVDTSSQNHRKDSSGLSCDVKVGDVQPKIADLKFNDFDKLREEVNFAVGQFWALYDTTDKVPRQYALIRKVSVVPCFGLRITYLEPDPDDEKEIQWFEEDLPVSAGKFRLGSSENTKDRSVFSHVIHCNKGSNTGHFTVSPRKGETWALFKNWDINWSSEPDSHRKYEYEFVEILSDYTDGAAGVSVAFLHKAKGFAGVFFRMGVGDADTLHISPHSLYRFSHRIPSFKLNGVKGKGLPKYAYELDQAALPEKIPEVTVPSHLLAKPAPPNPRPEELFTINGKVFQTGQIWSYIGCFDNMPRDYCRIYKISLTQAFEQAPVYKMHAFRFKAKPLPKDIIPWEEMRHADKKMPVGWGTYLLTQRSVALTPDRFSHLIVPVISKERNEYTILPKIGEVWAIYRFWTPYLSADEMEKNYVDYGIVEVLDDAFDYKVLALEPALQFNEDEEKKRVFRAAESKPLDFDDEDGTGVIFTIPRSKMLRFSHQIAASRVIKEIDGELKELFELDSTAVPVL